MSFEGAHHHYHISYKKPGTTDLMVKINRSRAGVRRITDQLRKSGYSYSVMNDDNQKCPDYLTVYRPEGVKQHGEATDQDRGSDN